VVSAAEALIGQTAAVDASIVRETAAEATFFIRRFILNYLRFFQKRNCIFSEFQ
jgi:hypothetical protein